MSPPLVGFDLIGNTFPGIPTDVAVTGPNAVTLRLPSLVNLMPGDSYEMSFEFVTQRMVDPDGDGI